ncbi:MAG TPA: hypothetical protein PLY46_10195, partial [Bacteroidales bacterium]|nr:hypothetical protein [Bacteroidales bacterium]
MSFVSVAAREPGGGITTSKIIRFGSAKLIIVINIKEEDTRLGYLQFNLNLIVDRPDGLIKEGK